MRRLSAAFALATLSLSLLVADDDTIAFSSDSMSGSSGKSRETTVLEGNASVSVGSLSIAGGRIELSGEDFRFVRATGGVIGKDSEKGFSFTADEVDYDRDTQIATLRGSAKLDDTKNEVSASASLISYNRETEVAILQVAVKLVRRKINCTSGFALYRRAVSSLELSGDPVVVRDGDDFRASRIAVDLETERITLDGSVSGTLKNEKKETVTPASPATPAVPASSPGEGGSGGAAPPPAKPGSEGAAP